MLRSGIFHYDRQVGLLTCVAAVLATVHPSGLASGVVAAFGIYGVLHASVLVVTLRAGAPARRRLWFVAISAALSMLSAALGLWANRLARGSGVTQLAPLLCLSSGFGAATYAILIRRFFAAPLTPAAVGRVVVGCIAATLAVFGSGLYLKNGGLWVAVSWWFALSLGLWFNDRRTAESPNLPGRVADGTIPDRTDDTEQR
jgi:hypothetical protein